MSKLNKTEQAILDSLSQSPTGRVSVDSLRKRAWSAAHKLVDKGLVHLLWSNTEWYYHRPTRDTILYRVIVLSTPEAAQG